MPNWQDPVEIAKEFNAAKFLAVLCLGAATVEFVHLARFDWSIISGQRKRRWPQVFYFLAKLVSR